MVEKGGKERDRGHQQQRDRDAAQLMPEDESLGAWLHRSALITGRPKRAAAVLFCRPGPVNAMRRRTIFCDRPAARRCDFLRKCRYLLRTTSS
jgi:hypothetical protein